MNCDVQDRAFRWPNGAGFVPIAFPNTISYSRATDLSASGLVVGDVQIVGMFGRRAFQSIDGITTYLPPLAGHNWSEAHGVNAAGLICGASSVSNLTAVYWDGGQPIALQLPIGPTTIAEDINDNNWICGRMGHDPYPIWGATPFIWQDGTTNILPLPSVAANDSGTALAINNLGDACGFYYIENASKAVPYLRRGCAWIGGQVIDLGTLPGCNETHPLDMNDAREIVGYCEPAGSGPNVPFLWRNGVMYDLRTLTPPPPIGPTMYIAAGINNKGQITGYGEVPLPVGHGVAFLLTPALPATPGDTNCDSIINVVDLLAVIMHWSPGPVGGDPADLNRDNRIDVNDLLQVIMHWS